MQTLFINKLISFLLALNIIVTPATAVNTTSNSTEPSTPIQIQSQSQIQIDNSLPEESQALKGLRWIDRIDWSGKEYGPIFYKTLESAVTNNGLLIDVTKGTPYKNGYYIPITTIENLSSSKAAAEAEIKQKADTIGQFMAVVYTAFQRDHPEVFWLSGEAQYKVVTTFTEYTTPSAPSAPGTPGTPGTCHYKADILFTLHTPTFDIRAAEYRDTEKIKSTIQLRDKLVSDIIQSAPSQSRYQQLEYFNKYIIESNEYNTSSDLYSLPRDCYECISALKGSSNLEGPTCGSYAHAFKVLCDQVGIPCVLVTGYANGTYHIWNYVQMEDNKWYGVDVTWNDGLSSQHSQHSQQSAPAAAKATTKAWFLIGSETKVEGSRFRQTHKVSNERLGIEYIGGPELSTEAYQAQ